MMEQAIEDGGGQHLIAEHLTPSPAADLYGAAPEVGLDWPSISAFLRSSQC